MTRQAADNIDHQVQRMTTRVFGTPATHMRAATGAMPLCGQVSMAGGPARTGYTTDPALVTCRKCLRKLPPAATGGAQC